MIENKVFGELKVISEIKKYNKIFYKCVCICGKEKDVLRYKIIKGDITNCGCKKEKIVDLDKRILQLQKYLYISTIKRRNKKLGYENCIDFEKFKDLIMSECFYCKRSFSNILEDWKARNASKGEKISEVVLKYNGIDRVDNNKGYEEDNVVSCCKFCNTAKHNLNLNEFKDMITRIYFKHKGEIENGESL